MLIIALYILVENLFEFTVFISGNVSLYKHATSSQWRISCLLIYYERMGVFKRKAKDYLVFYGK